VFHTGNRLSKRLIEVQLKIIITDAALYIRSRKIQKRPRIGLSACLIQLHLNFFCLLAPPVLEKDRVLT